MQGARSRILYRRSNGQSLSIRDDNLLGSGGEGSIYSLGELPDLVAKVYHSPSRSIGAKLTLMVDNPPTMPERDGHVSIAWPLDTLHSALPASPSNTVGFLMRRISSMQEVSQCYNPAARKRNFPHYTYRHLCAVAINIATAVDAVHGRNYVIGDINESNILINDSGLMTLIDTDSFQVIDQSDGTIYRSPVGKPEYTPPDLQGHSFDAVDRSQYHDRFGLGVIIFQLLMEGRHPYAGRRIVHHLYIRHNPTCPWCDRRDMLRGRDPFSGRSGPEPLLMRGATGPSASSSSGSAPPTPRPQLRPPPLSPASRPPPPPRTQGPSSALSATHMVSPATSPYTGTVELLRHSLTIRRQVDLGAAALDCPGNQSRQLGHIEHCRLLGVRPVRTGRSGGSGSAPGLPVPPTSIPVPALAVAAPTPTARH